MNRQSVDVARPAKLPLVVRTGSGMSKLIHWGTAFGILCGAIPAWAQDAAPAPAAPPMSRPLYLEWGITIAMIALAVFVVCRKSNRT